MSTMVRASAIFRHRPTGECIYPWGCADSEPVTEQQVKRLEKPRKSDDQAPAPKLYNLEAPARVGSKSAHL